MASRPLADAKMEEITVRAVITRADGTVEDQGTVCHWQRDETQSHPPKDGYWHILESGMNTAPYLAIDAASLSLGSSVTGTAFPALSSAKFQVAANNGGDFGNGALAEVIVLNYQPTAGEIEKIQGYLAWKWGSTGTTATDIVSRLPSGHAYKSGAPTSGTAFNQSVLPVASSNVLNAKSAGKKVLAPSVAVISIKRAVTKGVAAVSSSVSNVVRSTGKAIAATASSLSVATASRQIGKLITATAGSAVSFFRGTGKTLSVSAASSASVSGLRRLVRTLSVAAASAISVTRRTSKNISAAASTITTALAIRVYLAMIVAVCATAVSKRSGISRGVILACSAAVKATKAIGKRLSVSSGAAVIVTAVQAFLITVMVAAVTSVAVSKAAGKAIGTVALSAVSLSKRAAAAIASTVGSTVSAVAQRSGQIFSMAFVATAASAVSSGRSVSKSLVALASGSAAIAALFIHPVAAARRIKMAVQDVRRSIGSAVSSTRDDQTVIDERTVRFAYQRPRTDAGEED
jgi:hypothetical protein